ncbi:Enhancer of polycomb-like protein 1-like isoform X1 [Aphelenchoides besseyi]|nr:Enhancer of polycomb-like protein 1-like isoform X1 [Aphelenchoides besseyi]
MSSAGRTTNSTTGSVVKAKHTAAGLNNAQAARRLRSNNTTGNAPIPPSTKRHDGANSSTKSSPTKDTKHDGIPQRILAILESVPSTISVSSHPSNSLPSNFNANSNKKNEKSEFSSLKHRPNDGLVGNFDRKFTSRPTEGSIRRPFHASQRILKKHVGRRPNRHHSTVKSNGMPPPPLPSKMNFRARALDPQRQMPVHIVKTESKPESNLELEMLYNNKVLKRPLFNVPSGMEKEEEKEHHLRKAIEAQKSLTGAGMSNDHLIPTRQVTIIDSSDYGDVWKIRTDEKPIDYINYSRGTFDFCDEDTSYDADEVDMQFLESNGHFISLDEFEKIIEKLEVDSRDRILSLHEFHRQHPEVLIEKLERIYDYWIERRTKLVTESKMNVTLVPYVPNKSKAGEKDNPYIAFRHRGPKVTTRRKQKLDTEHYGSMLKLAAAIRRTHLLSKSMVEREALKSKILDRDVELFDAQLDLLQCGGSVDDLPDMSTQHEPSVLSQIVPSANKWLSMIWYEVARGIYDDSTLRREDDLFAISSRSGSEDGPFAFQRQTNCFYRSTRTSDSSAEPEYFETTTGGRLHLPTHQQSVGPNDYDGIRFNELHKSQNLFFKKSPFVYLNKDTWSDLTGEHRDVVCRSRYGRGGRLNLDFIYR